MKQRLDVALVERGLIASREKAKVVIMEGLVYVNGQKSDKAGAQVKDDDKIEVRGETLRYVSRGGKKLEKAMQVFPITLNDCICIDIGASTGGFTDCMLQNGAKKVYSVDVSFISLTLVLLVAYRLLRPGAQMVCLVKPQFEAGKDKVGKKGVVREPQIHKEVIQKVAACAKELGFLRMGLDFSPIKGPEGNIEYLLFLKKPENETQESEENLAEEKLPEIISEVVAQAHQSL